MDKGDDGEPVPGNLLQRAAGRCEAAEGPGEFSSPELSAEPGPGRSVGGNGFPPLEGTAFGRPDDICKDARRR